METAVAKQIPNKHKNTSWARSLSTSLARSRKDAREAKAKAKQSQTPVKSVAAVQFGALAAGYAEGMMPDGIFGLSAPLAVGAMGLVFGLATSSPSLVQVGSGALAATSFQLGRSLSGAA